MIIREASIKYINKGEAEVDSLDCPQKVVHYLERYIESIEDYDPEVEHFFVINTDIKNNPKSVRIVTKGTATASLVHPREVFRIAVKESAAAIIVAHNHPSGDPCPSRADMDVTKKLREAGKVLGIQLLDHVIVGRKMADPTGLGFYSFCDNGLI